ncbi:N-acyl-D-amino-acid deacylase family protein [Algoriphagus limi]|uniref:D-aminoacylase n=1 Tax=Algoriphagus limi TaxID=2975273 RepID=A0ABT2G4T2_9BACT|nr:D-aminoacylase [Algoriphagus limi]MCS5490107.1 D-aminoacylase [Algoriphagus limi]
MKINRILTLILFLATFACQSPKFDLVIKNGTVYSGDGSEGQVLDVGITGDRITFLGKLGSFESDEIIDATGLAVAPGFIDMHTHLEPILEMPLAESLVRQGVTLSLGGPDGNSPLPLDSYLDTLEQMEIGPNLAYLVGHNSIRRAYLGNIDRDPTEEELAAMKGEVDKAMDAGAFGISTGLKYLPGTFAKLDEVIALSKVAAAKGGIYTSHLREEGLGLIDAVQEAIQISRDAQIPVVLTHHKAIGVKMWGASKKTLALVDSAHQLGLDIMMDQYPYTASHTGISVLIPSWALEGGKFEERVNNPALKDSIKSGIVFAILNDRGGNDLRRIQFSTVQWDRSLEGQTLYDWIVREGDEPTVEKGAEYVIQAQLNGGMGTIYHAMDEEDVERIMKHPMTMIGSDGRLSKPGIGHPHPRAYGTFPRVLGYYVREKKIMDLSTAIHKMTGLSAKRLGLTDRGVIQEGAFADITIFNPETVIDQATFINPHQYPQGIEHVIINGNFAVKEGEFQQKGYGRVIRKNKP